MKQVLSPHDLTSAMRTGLPNVRIRTTANQNLAFGVFSQILFTTTGYTTTYDNWAMYDAVNERFRIQRPGLYQFGASAQFDVVAGQPVYGILRLWHGTLGRFAVNGVYSPVGLGPQTDVSGPFQCQTNDWVALEAFQWNGGGGALNLLGAGTNNWSVVFWAEMIGGYL